MIAVLVAVLTLTLVGLRLSLAIDHDARGLRLLGLAILYGSGAVMFALMLLSSLHIRWTAMSALLTLLALTVIASIVASRATGRATHPVDRPAAHILDAATAIMVISFAAYVSVTGPSEWDFWTDWGLKARVFLHHGGIDWSWLQNPWHDLAHPDYPVLVPLNYVFPELLHGGWSDRWLGLLFVAWTIAILLIVRLLSREEVPNWISAAATLAVAPVAASLYVGLAEGAFIAYAGGALLFLRRGLLRDDPLDWRHGTLLLGLAANCKNEGLALVAAVAAGIVSSEPRRWRQVLRLWPAIVVAAPWLLLRATHALPTDIARGSILHRFLERLSSPGDVLIALNELLADRWSWIAIFATLLIVPRAIARERFIVVVTAVQLMIYAIVYFVTPNESTVHIATSWDRLTRQMQLPITVVCVMLLGQVLASVAASSNSPAMR
jgi:hypothetical protein